MPKKTTIETPEKRIKVQIGVCKRLVKEVASYEKEVVTNEAKIQKMKDDGRDEYDIRKQVEVLQESYMMVPDSKGRLRDAIEELTCLVQNQADQQQEGEIPTELLEEAKLLIEQASAIA